MSTRLDCIVIGYYEPPFSEYEALVRQYGTESEAYRDLQFSFVEVENQKLTFVDLLNHARAKSKSVPIPERHQFKSGDIPNLAAVYLTHFLRKRHLAAEYINLFCYETARLVEYLDDDPLCVAITTTFYVMNSPVIDIVSFIRRHNSNVKIIVGGPLVANHARSHSSALASISQAGGSKTLATEAFNAAIEDLGADIYIVDSQGELTLAKVVECLKCDGNLSAIPNIAYRDESGVVMTARIPEANVLDDNYIDWTQIATERLGPTIQMRTARSCAFNCSFCNYPTRAGKLALASVDTVQNELDSIQSLEYVRNVVFIDDTFNVPLPRFKELCRLMSKRRYGFKWYSYFRCSNADDEAFDLMAESGCKGVFLGIESGAPKVLGAMNKAATVEKYAYGIEALRKRDIITFGSFINGFPSETDETVAQTTAFIRTVKPDYYRSQLWYCEPGTPIDGQRDKYGISGRGFKWCHNTMRSDQAMNHITRMFMSIDESLWLPQWSFDFWIIPYLFGRGVDSQAFKRFQKIAVQLLRMEFEKGMLEDRRARQAECLAALSSEVGVWNIM